MIAGVEIMCYCTWHPSTTQEFYRQSECTQRIQTHTQRPKDISASRRKSTHVIISIFTCH